MVRSWEGGAKAEQAVLVRATAAAAAVRWIAVMVLNILCFVYDETVGEERVVWV